MKTRILKTLPLSLIISAFLLGACGAVTIKDQAVVTAEFETAVATALTAQFTPNTPTPEATQTYIPSETPVPTLTETPTLTPIPPTLVSDTYCDNSEFVTDVSIPDKTILAPGQVFEKTWRLKNIGLCTWKPGYTIVFADGDAMKGNTRALNQTVAPGEEVEVTVRLTAPNTPKEYAGVWRLANGKGEAFGAFVSVVIITAGPETPYPTLTPIP